jgi:preprotein translocase subunit SecA
LVGTRSIEKNEYLSELLRRRGVKHEILNAKQHEREAEIIAQAGRGTDILLGVNADFMARHEAVKRGLAQPRQTAVGQVIKGEQRADSTLFYYQGTEFEMPLLQWEEIFAKYKSETDAEHDQVTGVGGLHILGTERHEARRIDNQLRGRAGRQGDPGSSRFYLSLEDDLMRIFAKEWVSNLLQRLGMEEGIPIESKLITRRIEAAQKAVEAQNFEARKHVLEYDDVMNKQRQAVYGLRRQLLEGVEQKELILEEYVAGILSELMEKHVPEKAHADDWDLEGLKKDVFTRFGVDLAAEGLKLEELNRQELGDSVFEKLKERYEAKERLIGAEQMRYHERMLMLSVFDQLWKEHLLNMDHLREGIGLRGYAQHDPLVEYKRESFEMFEGMMRKFEEDTVRYLYLMQIVDNATGRPVEVQPEQPAGGDGAGRRAQTTIDEIEAEFQRKKRRELEQARMAGSGDQAPVQQVRREGGKVGRNDPCPCGSGKKYKKCHGAAA